MGERLITGIGEEVAASPKSLPCVGDNSQKLQSQSSVHDLQTPGGWERLLQALGRAWSEHLLPSNCSLFLELWGGAS